jgi:hypothetical protein
MSLYKNQKRKEGHIHQPKGDVRIFEGTITQEVIDILWRVREQLGRSRTAQQTQVDALVRLVSPHFAFSGQGTDRLPVPYQPGIRCQEGNWWRLLLYEMVKLMHGYYEMIREGHSKLYTNMKQRFEDELLAHGILEYKPTHFKVRHADGYELTR